MNESLSKILKQERGNLFSFYLISGNRKENKSEVLEFLEKELGIQSRGNSDFFVFEGEKFLIDKAREIKQINSKTKAFEGQRIFILSFESIGIDTQNALLKVLEEPAEDTIFFFLVSGLNQILETIKSRARIIEIKSETIDEVAEEYMQATFLEREKITTELEKESVQSFFNSLDLLLLKNKEKIADFPTFYKKFLGFKKYIGRKGVSVKYILNYLNIYIPQV